MYAKVRDAMGGRVRHAMSGGSAMDRRLGLFFAGAGVTIYEGYGLTESTAAATANPPERTRYGTVGQPIPGTTVHIADDGEVWLHGGQVFSGYLNNQKATDAVPCTTAGSPPGTWARSTRTATSPSPGARRRSW